MPKTFDALPCRHFAGVCSVFWAFLFYDLRGLFKPPSLLSFMVMVMVRQQHGHDFPRRVTLQILTPLRTAGKMTHVPFFNYRQLLTSSREARTCSLISLDSSRSCARWPPVQAFLLTRCLPSGDFGPVDLAHGCHVRINSACRALRSGVQVVAMICLQ